MRVLDDLDGLDLTYAGNVGGIDPPDVVDLSTLGSNSPIFSWDAPNGIAVDGVISFTFDITVNPSVAPQQILANTIQADWTSLPGPATALNSSGSIGENGSSTGMRNGTLPHSGQAVNDYEATAEAQLVVPAPTLSKIDLEPAMIPTIGVHRKPSARSGCRKGSVVVSALPTLSTRPV